MSIFYASQTAGYALITLMKLYKQVLMSLFTLQLVFAMTIKVRSSFITTQRILAKQDNVEHHIHANQSLKLRSNIVKGLRTGVFLCHIYQK